MDDQPTCGQGLAANAGLPAKQTGETFRRFVRLEEELVNLLQNRLERDRGMLIEMEQAQRGGS